MPATITINRSRYPFTDPSSGWAQVTVDAGDPYATGGIGLLDALNEALETFFGVDSFSATTLLPQQTVLLSDDRHYSAVYDTSADEFLIRHNSMLWSDQFQPVAHVVEIPDDVRSISAVNDENDSPLDISFSAPAQGEVQIDWDNREAIFNAIDDQDEVRFLWHRDEEVANATNLSGVEFTFLINYSR